MWGEMSINSTLSSNTTNYIVSFSRGCIISFERAVLALKFNASGELCRVLSGALIDVAKRINPLKSNTPNECFSWFGNWL